MDRAGVRDEVLARLLALNAAEATIVQRAKELARRRRTSLSGLVEEYLRFASAGLDEPPAVSVRVQAVAESLPMPPDATYDRLQEQYLRGKLLGASISRDNTRHYPKTDVAILSPADFLQLHGAALALMGGGGPGRPS